MKAYISLLVAPLLLVGCANALSQRAAQLCPASIPAPVLEVGDTWNMQDEDGRNMYRRYIRRTDDGLLEREDRPGGIQLFYDDAHTLRKAFRDGRWITDAAVDFPSLGKPSLVFPLQVGKTWSHLVTAKSVGIGNLTYNTTYTVVGCETVTAPAGTFFTVMIEETQRPVGFNAESRTWWYAPDVKSFVKLAHTRREYWSKSRDFALTSYRLASSTPKPPQSVISVAPTPNAPSSITSGQNTVTSAIAPLWERGYEWKYRWTSPRGSGTFVWMMAREEAVSEVPYYVMKTRAREIYYTKAELALAMEGAKGVVKRRATPASCVFEWPLVVGKEWEEKYVWENLAERTTKDRHRHYKVEAVDTVTVPAGTFQTFHVMVKESTGKLVGEYWYSPEAKWFVKDRTYHSYGVREQELLEYKVR